MILTHTDAQTGGLIQFIYEEENLKGISYNGNDKTLLTIIWNRGAAQEVTVDDEVIDLNHHEAIVFNTNQTFSFQDPTSVVAWRFNRDFYCIIDHDQEVSCVGLLFYGHKSIPRISLDKEDQRRLELLFNVFLDEYSEEDDNLKTEMLRVILKRLIVKLTRSYKRQTQLEDLQDGEMNIVRQFNLMVEKNYKEYHQVQDYADLLHKSSKTISNIFSKYSKQSPLEVIHHRILVEAKRLLIYTDKTAKEIAYELGFSDIPNFSRFFKKNLQLSPLQYREEHKKTLVGKN